MQLCPRARVRGETLTVTPRPEPEMNSADTQNSHSGKAQNFHIAIFAGLWVQRIFNYKIMKMMT